MADHVRQTLTGILAYHAGGWIDNGKPDKCRCHCGHRGELGEFHGTHVADAIVAELADKGYQIVSSLRMKGGDF
jgi:hypothetical protein